MSAFSKARSRTASLIAIVLIAAAALALARRSPSPADEAYDVVILNGRVMDPESGLDAVRNVGVKDGKITAISSEALHGTTAIDAKGLVVAPGFIDLHEHGQEARNYEFQAHDGVTTSLELEVGTDDVDAWYAARAGKSLINFGVSVGLVPVRMRVMHDPSDFLPSGDAPTKKPQRNKSPRWRRRWQKDWTEALSPCAWESHTPKPPVTMRSCACSRWRRNIMRRCTFIFVTTAPKNH